MEAVARAEAVAALEQVSQFLGLIAARLRETGLSPVQLRRALEVHGEFLSVNCAAHIRLCGLHYAAHDESSDTGA